MLVVLLPLVVLVASVWANTVSAGANASAPEARMNACSAVAAAAQILRVMFALLAIALGSAGVQYV